MADSLDAGDPAMPDREGGDAREGEDAHGDHRSVWPVVGAAGAAGLYVGLALVVLAEAVDTVPAALGAVVAVGGVLGLVAGLLGWTDEAFLSGVQERTEDDATRARYRTTMVVFLATDIATFAAGFVYYFFVRALAWPPEHLPHLLSSLVAANTAVLLASSVTLHYAHHALSAGNYRRFVRLLGVTLAAGVVFLAGQVYEYYTFVVEEGFTLADGVFASAFFGLTGLHGFHVSLGVAMLAILFVRARRGDYGPERDTSVATVSLYWHFVDAVWLFLVAVVYVGAAV